MSGANNLPIRGRPKTLQRDHVLQTAMMCYWSASPTDVPISEICNKAGVSKPGLYREFGSDDGLKESVLDVYSEMVSAPLHDILATNQPFDEAIDALITYTIQNRRALGLPDGCLLFAMRDRHDELGTLTRNRVDLLRKKTLKKYKDWIDRAKANGEFTVDLPTDIVAYYFDAQSGSAMRLQKDGVSNAVIGEFLKLAFSVFR